MKFAIKRPTLWVLFLSGLLAFILPFGDARSDAEAFECFWSPAKKQCLPDGQLFIQPIAGLTASQTQQFEEGLKQFKAAWSVFPLIDGEWGLGPTFLSSSCEGCHVNAGRGKTTDALGKPVFQQLVRISAEGTGASEAPLAHPNYGNQIQAFSIFGDSPQNPVVGEAEVYVDWVDEMKTLGDGTEVSLRRPQLRFAKTAFGPLGASTMTSLRNTPVVFGLGYLDAVAEDDILQLAAQQKAQGLNGRPNYVQDDISGKRSLGRFGWKANQPSLKQQVAAAHIGDMGITSSLYSEQNCPKPQSQCQAAHQTGDLELTNRAWEAVTLFMAGLEAPKTPPSGQLNLVLGAQVFHAVGCSGCHVPELKTGPYPLLPAIENKRFTAYTDLLLHDMGEGLADHRPDFKASGRDWRTAPLWGIGLSRRVNGSVNLLHDGRARNVTEAILWHGGEAEKSQQAFAALEKEKRNALIDFVNSL